MTIKNNVKIGRVGGKWSQQKLKKQIVQQKSQFTIQVSYQLLFHGRVGTHPSQAQDL